MKQKNSTWLWNYNEVEGKHVMTWSDQVIEDATGEIIKTIPVHGESKAQRVESAIDIKFNHDNAKFTVVQSRYQSASGIYRLS